MIIKSALVLSIVFLASTTHAGYGEINVVGDVRQLNNIQSVQSTVTESPTWKDISKNAAHYEVEKKNADNKEKNIILEKENLKQPPKPPKKEVS